MLSSPRQVCRGLFFYSLVPNIVSLVFELFDAAREPVRNRGAQCLGIEDIIDYEEIPQALLTGDKEYFALEVKGDSMWPDYLPGDVVIVRKQPICNSGDDCIVYVNGYDATLKQVKFNDADRSLSLVPRNPSYPPRTFTQEEVDTLPVTIAGVVVELRRKIKK